MNWKKTAIIGTAAIGAALLFAGCGGSGNEQAASDGKPTKIIAGLDDTFAPMGFRDDKGQLVGFDIDIAKAISKETGVDIEFKPIDWSSKETELNSGRIDCIWNGFTMNGREDDYTWSDPYIDNKQVVVVRSDSGIDDFSGLKGKHVEVQTDSSALAALEGDQKDLAATFADLNQVAEYNTAFMDLESGACDAIAMDIGVANYQVNSRKNPDDYKILDKEISSEQYAVGFKKGNTELKDKVQKTLDEMAEDGTVDKIAEKYADYGVPGALCIGKNSK